MQTQEQVTDKVQGMLIMVHQAVLEDIKSILQSGAVDLTSFEDNYRLPKLLLHVTLKNTAVQYSPLSWDKEAQTLIDNLSCF